MFFSFPKAFPKNGNYFMLSEGGKKREREERREEREEKGRARRKGTI
jgi:hypothetical protein